MALKVLHITNWYPGERQPYHAAWLKKLILSLNPHFDQTIYHIEIIRGKPKFRSGKNKDGSQYMILQLPFVIWRINEILSAFMVVWVYFIREKRTRYGLINFHIAYPNCTYLHRFKTWIGCPVVISEHWSGYHFDFNISRPEKRTRIQRIFRQNIPVITVSKALLTDIIKFSKTSFPHYIIPNIVSTETFRYNPAAPEDGHKRFLMFSQWKWPKDPFTVIKLWPELIAQFPEAHLTIGGYGEQWNAINKLIRDTGMEDYIQLKGLMTPEAFAAELNRADAFIHCSGYETFSVVCAEALCCGIPVIASRVGGIVEYVDDKNGMLVDKNDHASFLISIREFLSSEKRFDRTGISRDAAAKFNSVLVGEKYRDVLLKISAGEVGE